MQVTRETILQVTRALKRDQGVYLMPYGNVMGSGTLTKMTAAQYDAAEANGTIFEVDNVQRAVNDIERLFPEYRTDFCRKLMSSYGAKHMLEDARRKADPHSNPYITNGDFIVALLLAGRGQIKAVFAGEVNCAFSRVRAHK